MKIWHPYTQHALFPQEDLPIIERSEGSYLYGTWAKQDQAQTHHATNRQLGKKNVHSQQSKTHDKHSKWLDAISSWWVITHRHNHPHICKAIQDAASEIDQIIFAGTTHTWAQKLTALLQLVLPKHLKYTFFSDSGATAIEVAIKLAIGYWYHQKKQRSHSYSNSNSHSDPNPNSHSKKDNYRNRLIVLEHSYHGDTYGAMAVGERSIFTQPYMDQLFEVEVLPMSSSTDNDAASSLDYKQTSRDHEAASLDHLENLLKRHPNRYAAFLLEPLILGAGGMVMRSPEFVVRIGELCQAHDVLLIVDEIMTGWGRTGKLFALDYCESVQPDIICYGKGITGGALPLAITTTTEKIYAAFHSKDRRKTFFHSSSYTANPIACAAAQANLEIWLKGQTSTNANANFTGTIIGYQNPYQQIQRISDFHKKHWHQFQTLPICKNVRHFGTIVALDVTMPESGYLSPIGLQLYEFFLRNGVLLRPLGNVLYLMPPYCTTNAELDNLYALIRAGLDEVSLCK